MRVAVASTDVHPDSRVHHTFGKSPYFTIFDSSKGEMTAFQNPLQTSGVSTGVEVARILVNQGIDKVVAGRFGERVERVFSDAGVQVEVVGDKTVNDCIRSLPTRSGGMKPLSFPSTDSSHLDDKPARIERGTCYCSSCGYSTSGETEAPCFQRRCPNCKTQLERKY
jgi:predicted Fe-Mo cluster-binding NifX family protein